MFKTDLLHVINKYHLNGEVQSVLWKIENNNLVIDFVDSTSASIIGNVTTKEIDFSELADKSLGVYDTTQLMKLLSVLDETFSVNVKFDNSNSIPIALVMSDASTKMEFALTDPLVLPKVPKAKSDFVFSITTEFTKENASKLVKACNAVAFDNIYIKGDSENLYFFVGNPKINSNSSQLKISYSDNKPFDSIGFKTKSLADILKVNSGADKIELSINTIGLLKVTAEYNNLTCTYYITRINEQ